MNDILFFPLFGLLHSCGAMPRHDLNVFNKACLVIKALNALAEDS